jgi:hypothetical protein
MKRVTKLFSALFFVMVALIGCTAPYNVKTMNDEFPDPNSSLTTKTMTDNFINSYADPLKLVPASQLNAYVMLDKNTDKVQELGVFLINVRHSGGIMHASNSWLNIREGDELIILTDSKRLSLYAKRPRVNSTTSSNSVTHSIDTNYFDYVFYPIQKEDFKALAFSQTFKMKVTGQNGADEYKDQINAGLLPNLLRFYQEEIEASK